VTVALNITIGDISMGRTAYSRAQQGGGTRAVRRAVAKMLDVVSPARGSLISTHSLEGSGPQPLASARDSTAFRPSFSTIETESMRSFSRQAWTAVRIAAG
jgi:hypothetical protein